MMSVDFTSILGEFWIISEELDESHFTNVRVFVKFGEIARNIAEFSENLVEFELNFAMG